MIKFNFEEITVGSVVGRARLNDIVLSIRGDDKIGLIGKNGSGKTTLARLLAGLERPFTGKLRVNSKLRPFLILQRPGDFFIYESVAQQIANYGRKKLSIETLVHLLNRVGLDPDIQSRSPLHLSNGQQRLLAFTCALAAEPMFFILDEPFAGLDQQGRQMVWRIMNDLTSGGTPGFLIISHHPDDLIGLVERLLILDAGRLIYDGPFHEAPIDSLLRCLAPHDPSLYLLLRRLEEQGLAIPHQFYYQQPNPAEIARLFKRLWGAKSY